MKRNGSRAGSKSKVVPEVKNVRVPQSNAKISNHKGSTGEKGHAAPYGLGKTKKGTR